MVKFKKGTIFITGSSSGIGYGLAKNFQKDGFRIIINGTNFKRLKNASKSLNNCDFYVGDITKENVIKKIFKNIKKKIGKLDFLICNYGNSDFKKNNLDFRNSFEKNFFSTVNTIKYFLPISKKNISKIVCVSSICGIENIKGAPIAYSVAKSAINNYVKVMSSFLGEKKITINAVAPGNIYFKGSVWEKKMKKNKKQVSRYIRNNVPINTFGKISDIFSVCKTIINSETQYLTGSTYIIDGGQTKKF